MTRPCLTCGEPSTETRCDEHRDRDRTFDQPKTSSTSRGYDTTWRKLSERARRQQPWCSDCYATTDLTTDHSERAWKRKAEGKAIRLRDVDVVCRPCNARRGRARPWGETPTDERPDPPGEAKRPLHTPRGYR